MELESVLGTVGVNWEYNTGEIQHQLDGIFFNINKIKQKNAFEFFF